MLCVSLRISLLLLLLLVVHILEISSSFVSILDNNNNINNIRRHRCRRHHKSHRSGSSGSSSSSSNWLFSSSLQYRVVQNDNNLLSLSKTERRKHAANIVNEHLLPSIEYGNRIQLGLTAQNLQNQEEVFLLGNDPVLSETYGEFPLDGLDILLDRAEELQQQQQQQQQSSSLGQRKTVVDLGSGCGRLALYMALARGNDEKSCWDVHGIEISPIFHNEAIKASNRAVQGGWIANSDDSAQFKGNTVHFHVGPAHEYADLLRQADLIFCYSTAFDSAGFSQKAGAMILDPYWSELLAQTTNPQQIVITTEKALDPAFANWKIMDRIDVPNHEVFESTGFIQQIA